MKENFKQFKPFVLFLIRFFAVYGILLLVYNFYLSKFDDSKNEVDGITQMVANQSMQFLHLFDKTAHLEPNTKEASCNLFYKNQWLARVIEGCNAISIIILFASFVVAFKGNYKNTLLFIIFGSLLIYVFNVLRIGLLVMLIYHFSNYKHFLHGVFFPLIIYGFVFLMWLFWVNKFSYHAKINTK